MNNALWSDERVYQLAKEIELLQTEEFNNIDSLARWLPYEKIIICCLGKYLAVSRIKNDLDNKKLFALILLWKEFIINSKAKVL